MPIVVAAARGQRLRAAWMRDVAEARRARVEDPHSLTHELLQRSERHRVED